MSEIEKIMAQEKCKDGKRRPLQRMAYQHITGKIYVIWGTCTDFKTKDKEMVILSSLDDSDVTYFPLASFWDIAPPSSPKAGTPRFQLVTPS